MRSTFKPAGVRRVRAERTAHRLALEVTALRGAGITSHAELARAMTERSVPARRGGAVWTLTTVARVLSLAMAKGDIADATQVAQSSAMMTF